ncbi:MAG: hypothetical protein IPN05_17650 [Sulfuritalea sp.]|nr:hypothetical protein [Sulfuritalea sp.]
MIRDTAHRRAAGFEIGPDFEAFAQRNDFYRVLLGSLGAQRKTERFYATYREPLAMAQGRWFHAARLRATQRGLAGVSDLFTEARRDDDRREGFSDPYTQQLPPASARVAFATPQAAAKEIKRVARAFGAGDVGIAARDERWMARPRRAT